MSDITSFPIQTTETNLTAQQLRDTVDASHRHLNMDVIDEFGEDADGALTYKGFPIQSGGIDELTKKLDDVAATVSSLSEKANGGIPVPLSSVTISGSIAPSVNKAPETTVSNSQINGTITWLPPIAGGSFDFSTIYTAEIQITPKPGHSLEGITAADFNIGVPGSAFTYDPDSATLTVTFPKTTDKPVNINSPWEITYSVPGSMAVLTFNNSKIPVSAFSGYDGNQVLSDDLYDITIPSNMPVELWAEFIGGSFVLIPFDNFANSPSGGNSIREWGYDSASNSIYLVGSNSTGEPIELKLKSV